MSLLKCQEVFSMNCDRPLKLSKVVFILGTEMLNELHITKV